MAAVTAVVARFGRISAADAAATADGVVPVVVVVGGSAVPATILVDERRVVPIVAGVLPADDETLAGVAQRPHLRRADVLDIPFDGLERGWLWVGRRLRRDVLDARVGLNVGHVGPRG